MEGSKKHGTLTCSLAKSGFVGHTQSVKQRVFVFWLVFASAVVLSGTPMKFDTLKVGSETYHHVTVLGVSATDLYISYDAGIINLKLKYLDPKLQELFDYDPHAAKQAERQQIKDEADFQDSIVQAVKERVEKEQQKVAVETTLQETSPSDPVSDGSLLNKPAPPLEVEEWIGQKPSLENKFVLVEFWTTWSTPCRKIIPQLNSWQEQYTNNLVVVGLSSQSEEDVTAFKDPNIEYFRAVDTKNRMAKAAGAISVPYVLLIDPKGIVRYQGHPAAINEDWLQSLFQLPEEEE